jgi:hypothetical protein
MGDQKHRRRPGRCPAPGTLRDEVRALLESHGASGLERELNIPRRTLACLAAGLPVLEGTVALVRQRIREWREDAAEEASPEKRLRLVPPSEEGDQ